jgi:hypothetical protein
MATKKKVSIKKGKLRDLSKSKKTLTSDQAKAVKGGTVRKAGGEELERLKVKLSDQLSF